MTFLRFTFVVSDSAAVRIDCAGQVLIAVNESTSFFVNGAMYQSPRNATVYRRWHLALTASGCEKTPQGIGP